MIRRLFFFIFAIAVLLTACSDNETFSTSSGNRLTFSEDTIFFDTLFSAVPSTTQTFWVHNDTDDGIRIQTARLERGTQSGFRVNIDGTYLNPVGNDFEVRKGDSLLVFVEVTTREVHAEEPQLVEDNLILTLESGVDQRVNLRAMSWDAVKLTDLVISRDTTIETSRPVIVYGSGILVEQGAKLTLRNTILYFHDGAGLTVSGQIDADSCLFRGDRLDYMFDYLPYDRIPSQWEGIYLTPESSDNTLSNCTINNAVYALVCDSTDLILNNTVIHNAGGGGLYARYSALYIEYCQFTNTYGDCVYLEACEAEVDHCTIGQFYPFSANRGAALRFRNAKAGPMLLSCTNTLVTGYEADVLMREKTDSVAPIDFYFGNCLLRTDSVSDPERLVDILWETPKDSVQGTKHFKTIDEDKFYYDFSIDSISPAFARRIGRILE